MKNEVMVIFAQKLKDVDDAILAHRGIVRSN